jgi:hypothetical protein
MKIGIIGGYVGEIVPDTPYRKWMDTIPDRFYSEAKGGYLFERALAADLKVKYKDVEEATYITKFDESKLQQNDINFLVGNNLLNSWEKSKPEYTRVYNIMKNKKNKIYPPLREQFFLYNKGDYLKYYEKKGIPIAPTFLVKQNRDVDMILSKVKRHKWESFVLKPYYAYANMSIQRIDMNDTKTRNKLQTYLTKNKKYPAFICQEVMVGFATKWELKTFWINGKFAYYIATKASDQVFDEEDIYKTSYADLGSVSQKILSQVKKLGKKVLDLYPYRKNNSYPLYLRIDFGCCLGNTLDTSKYFLNEIEYCGCGIFMEAKNTLHHWTKGHYEKAKELTS